jgi:hypothetical protein
MGAGFSFLRPDTFITKGNCSANKAQYSVLKGFDHNAGFLI